MQDEIITIPLQFGESFVELFTGMSYVAGICYLLGLVLIVIEIFQQGSGVFGGVGAMLAVLGVAIRVSDSKNLVHLFMLVLVAAAVVVAAFLIMNRATRMGWIARAAHPQQTVELSAVSEKCGVALTELAPSGKVEICGHVYDAVTAGDDRIRPDSRVKAVGVSEHYVVVEPEYGA